MWWDEERKERFKKGGNRGVFILAGASQQMAERSLWRSGGWPRLAQQRLGRGDAGADWLEASNTPHLARSPSARPLEIRTRHSIRATGQPPITVAVARPLTVLLALAHASDGHADAVHRLCMHAAYCRERPGLALFLEATDPNTAAKKRPPQNRYVPIPTILLPVLLSPSDESSASSVQRRTGLQASQPEGRSGCGSDPARFLTFHRATRSVWTIGE